MAPVRRWAPFHARRGLLLARGAAEGMMRPRRAAWLAAALLALPFAATADTELHERAEAGDAEAQFELARRYSTGTKGTQKDEAEAARWFRLSAEQGHPRAQANLAFVYEQGRGVPRDDAEAINWLVKAAKQGHPRAMFLLGERFEQGRGVPQSNVIAHMWMRRAAGAGSPAAQFRVAELEKRLDARERKASSRLDLMERQRRLGARHTAP